MALQSVMLLGSSVMLNSLMLLTVALMIVYYWQQNTRYFKLGNLIPGPTPLPFIGNVLEIIGYNTPKDIMFLLLSKIHKYPDIGRVWLGSKLNVYLSVPADVELILGSNTHLKKSSEYRFFQPWLGDGLLISHGEKWRTHRKMIAPTFHLNILKSFMDVFNKKSRQVVKKMQEETGKTFDVHDYMSGTTVDILLETAMGVTEKKHNNAGFEYAHAVMKMCEITHLRQITFYLRSQFIFNWTSKKKLAESYLKIIHSLTRKVIKERKADYISSKLSGNKDTLLETVTKEVEYDERLDAMKKKMPEFKGLRDDLDDIDENDIGQKKRLAFLDFMIEASQSGTDIDDNDIKEEVDTIMFEGHDTTAAGSSFTLCMLGVHQHYQEIVMQELNDIFGGSDRACTYADTLEMKVLERVIMETLRLFPPVPAIAREITEDVQLVSRDLVIPAGTTVVIPQYLIHRRPEIYNNPEEFDPDRFLPERCQERHYYSFIPFSAGPRSCVGRKYALLKLKVLLSTILRNFRVISDVAQKDFQLQGDIILKRADGFRLRLESRNAAA